MCLSGFYFCSLVQDDSRVLSCCLSFSAVSALTLPPAPYPALKSCFHCLIVPGPGFLLLPHRMEESLILFHFPGAAIHSLMEENYGVSILAMTSEGKGREARISAEPLLHSSPELVLCLVLFAFFFLLLNSHKQSMKQAALHHLL